MPPKQSAPFPATALPKTHPASAKLAAHQSTGVLGKEFTVADVDSLAEFKPVRKSSTWPGRAVFIGVGLGLILTGIGIALR